MHKHGPTVWSSGPLPAMSTSAECSMIREGAKGVRGLRGCGRRAMFNTTSLVIEALSRHLVSHYRRVFGQREPDHGPAIATAVRLALERIALSDALYHDVEHT